MQFTDDSVNEVEVMWQIICNHMSYDRIMLIMYVSMTDLCSLIISLFYLTHWGRVTHICVSKLTIIGSDDGLSLGRRQANIWTNAGILLMGPLETNFSEILIEFHALSVKKIHLNISSGKLRPFCLGLNELSAYKKPALCLLKYYRRRGLRHTNCAVYVYT